MPSCGNCGEEVEESLESCPSCGESFLANEGPEPQEQIISLEQKRSKTFTFPLVVAVMVLLNAVIFLATVDGSFNIRDSVVESYGFVPAFFFSEPLSETYSIFTSMFLHANIIHIGMNMFVLLSVGKSIESVLGHRRFLFIYILSGIGAVLIHGFVETAVSDGMNPLIGASGAISGVLGASVILGNRNAIGWFAIQLVLAFVSMGFALGGGSISNIAFMAHVGGFIVGAGVTKIIGLNEKGKKTISVLLPCMMGGMLVSFLVGMPVAGEVVHNQMKSVSPELERAAFDLAVRCYNYHDPVCDSPDAMPFLLKMCNNKELSGETCGYVQLYYVEKTYG
jgi:membrane associated rhomboid family serine protease